MQIWRLIKKWLRFSLVSGSWKVVNCNFQTWFSCGFHPGCNTKYSHAFIIYSLELAVFVIQLSRGVWICILLLLARNLSFAMIAVCSLFSIFVYLEKKLVNLPEWWQVNTGGVWCQNFCCRFVNCHWSIACLAWLAAIAILVEHWLSQLGDWI